MIFEVFHTLFTLEAFSSSSFNFGIAGLNLDRWSEKEQARRKVTRPLVEQNYKNE